MNSRKFALIAVFLVQLLYGLNYTYAKNVINEGFIQSFAFVLLRVIGATILFWGFSFFFKKQKIEPKDFVTIFFAAVFGVGINMLLFLKGLELTTPIHASVIMTITPVIILVLSIFFLDEKLTKLKVFGIVIAFSGGILLTALGDSTRVGDNVALGNLCIFINAISYSIYVIIIKRLTAKYHPFTFIKWLFLFGIILTLPFGYQETLEIQWHTFTPYIWFSVLFVIIGATFGTYLLNPLALNSLKASTVGTFIYLQPVIAGVFAIVMGVDAVSPVKLIAMLFIFSGVYLVTKKTKVLA
ncbi:DMT family transporter [Psychroserpens jangbogonensis]|uniref:DMT family transporter n=1 Tax=Psychroserpens jangbogonensis TaxID=1484460 RepID=UPI00053D50D2|nr:DMT family transporter [Psychroserpens jangbogonensis]